MKIQHRHQKALAKEHWLDYAEEKYGTKLVADTKAMLNVIILLPPVPLFWALYQQQNSRWVFMAQKMNGDLGFFTVHPDQVSLVNSILVIILLPIFDYLIYPMLAKIGIKNHLQRATLGGVTAGISFVVSALVEIQVEKNFIHMVWLMPQYLLITIGEVLLNVSL